MVLVKSSNKFLVSITKYLIRYKDQLHAMKILGNGKEVEFSLTRNCVSLHDVSEYPLQTILGVFQYLLPGTEHKALTSTTDHSILIWLNCRIIFTVLFLGSYNYIDGTEIAFQISKDFYTVE